MTRSTSFGLGMFVGVTVVLPEENKVTVIPTTAVMHAPYGDSVYVLPSRPTPVR